MGTRASQCLSAWLKTSRLGFGRPLTCEPILACCRKRTAHAQHFAVVGIVRFLDYFQLIMDEAQMSALLQRFMTRLDHIEYKLVKEHQEEIANVRNTVGRFQKARKHQ